MRDLRRNQQKIYYKQFVRSEQLKDEYGNYSGAEKNIYSDLRSINISLSANKGITSEQMFGNLADYDRTMSVTSLDCEINENSILWIDTDPITKPHNFIVKKVAKSLNETVYAIKQVTVQ